MDSVSKTQKKDSNGNFSSICLTLVVTLASNNTQKTSKIYDRASAFFFKAIVNVVRGLKGREILFVIQRCTGSNFCGNFPLLCKLEAICARKE